MISGFRGAEETKNGEFNRQLRPVQGTLSAQQITEGKGKMITYTALTTVSVSQQAVCYDVKVVLHPFDCRTNASAPSEETYFLVYEQPLCTSSLCYGSILRAACGASLLVGTVQPFGKSCQQNDSCCHYQSHNSYHSTRSRHPTLQRHFRHG